MLRSRSAHASSRYHLRRGETRRRDRFVCWRNNRRRRRTQRMEPWHSPPELDLRHNILPRAAGQCGESSLEAIAARYEPKINRCTLAALSVSKAGGCYHAISRRLNTTTGDWLGHQVAPVQRVKHDTLSRCCSRFGENIRLSSYVS